MKHILETVSSGAAALVPALRQAALALTLAAVSVTSFADQRPWEQFSYPDVNNFNMPDLEIFELDNGVRFYLVEDKELPLIDLTVLIRSGGIHVADDQVGLNSLVGAVMRSGGTESIPGDELNELLEDRAAIMEVDFGFTSGTARMNVLAADFADLLPTFIDLLTESAFPEDLIELAKTQQRSSIARRNDDQGSVAGREFQRLIYGEGSRYSRRIEYEHLNNISREDLVEFHRHALVGANLMVGV